MGIAGERIRRECAKAVNPQVHGHSGWKRLVGVTTSPDVVDARLQGRRNRSSMATPTSLLARIFDNLHTLTGALDAGNVSKTSCSIVRQHASTNAGSDRERLLVAEISGPKLDSVDVRLINI